MTTRQVTISGRVREFAPGGPAISAVRIDIYDYNSAAWVANGFSDANGNYSLTMNLNVDASNRVRLYALARKAGFAPNGRNASTTHTGLTVNFWLVQEP